MKTAIAERLAAALPIVEAAGEHALRYFRQPLDVENKLGTGFDPVTVADREVEALIRQRLLALWPDSSVEGEEAGLTPGTSPWSWIVDPIDGTRAFISGMPAWGVLLGLRHEGQPVGGLVCQPFTGETFLGGARAAIHRRGGVETPLVTSGRTALGEAILYCTHPDIFTTDDDRSGFARVAKSVRMVRYGGDCYAYCLLAMGFVDLVIESSLQPYDILPLAPIITAAGGVVTDLGGEPPLRGGTVIAAATPELHAAALALMRTE
jgi:histidinol phosphatase-like enzyme (inositol monophosphatase family)